ncbi:hypothetical protein GS399_00640 [Pedobacter sp. HMF7647]|uniref:Uncharacterized protein n=1 Tax=Hufsiella arboris TaxID=2695275 RepID=A0A7K1Y4F9_9SPHI|nr:DUF6266 family protein [Hufsiella arboris]MXV49462.1 hypothetical protein [Hufsiella arboris]
MGKLPNGILGGISGKVGTVVGYVMNGKAYVRSAPRKSEQKPSAAQLAMRQRFALAQNWLKPLTPFVRIGCKNYGSSGRGFIAAKSYLMHYALTGTHPEVSVDPAMVMVAWGKLPQATGASVSLDASGNLSFQWDANEYRGTNFQNDHVMLLAYIPEAKLAAFDLCGARRSKGGDTLKLDAGFSGKEADVYMAFITEEREELSNSQYLGRITVI